MPITFSARHTRLDSDVSTAGRVRAIATLEFAIHRARATAGNPRKLCNNPFRMRSARQIVRLFFSVLLLAAHGTAQSPPAKARPGSAAEERADRVVVLKAQRELQLWAGGRLLRTYKVALGGEPVGAKQQQGDHKTPEGKYVLDSRNPKSQFYKSIHISYPNAADRARTRRMGVSPGGAIMIHGLPNGFGAVGAAHRLRDWTDGCIAVTNQEMDEIWRLVRDGTPIEIKP